MVSKTLIAEGNRRATVAVFTAGRQTTPAMIETRQMHNQKLCV
jgi:hypothetical protein